MFTATEVESPLNLHETKELSRLKTDYRDIFSSTERPSTIANTTPAVIKLKTTARAPFVDHGGPSLNLQENALVESQLKTWLKEKIIEPSTSPNRTYLLIAYNKKKKARVCPAFLSLNAATIFDPYPMPTANDIRRSIGGSKVFSVIDLKSAFTSMPLDPVSRDLTTFVFNGQRWRFTRSQWGLLNSATLFQRYIETIIADMVGVYVYMDDILVYAPSVEVMLIRLRLLFDRLRSANLLINSDKCKLCMQTVPYLGNVLEPGIVRPDPKRIKAILEWKFPATTSELRSFVGAAAMLSSYIPDFGNIKGILNPLLSTKTAYLPSQRQIEAFNALLFAIQDAGMLHQPEAGVPMFLRTDASIIGLGALLYQLDPAGNIKPLYYLSRALHDTETRYESRKLELLAVKWSLASLRSWVIGCDDLTIITDHESLVSCLDKSHSNATINRWCAEISEYAPKFQYRPGVSNHFADFLSRHPQLAPEPSDGDCDLQSERVAAFSSAVLKSTEVPTAKAAIALENSKKAAGAALMIDTTPGGSPTNSDNEDTHDEVIDPIWLDHDKLRDLQRQDLFCQLATKSLDSARNAADFSRSNRNVIFTLDDKTGLLLATVSKDKQVIVAPVSTISGILTRLHDLRGHFGFNKTLKLVTSEFYWKNIRNDVDDYTKNCLKCAERSRPTSAMTPATHIGSLSALTANDTVSSDIVGPFPLNEEGLTHIVTFTDNYSRYNVSVALKDCTAQSIETAFLNNWILHFGAPARILTDNGPQYTSTYFNDFLSHHGIKHVYTTTYNPSGDGIAERYNRTLMATLSKTAPSPHLWYKFIAHACFAHNTTVSAATDESPYLLMHGRPPRPLVTIDPTVPRDPNIALNANTHATEKLLKAQENIASANTAMICPYTIGDVVLVHDPVIPRGPGGKRLHLPYTKQRIIIGIDLPTTLLLTPIDGGHTEKVHMNRVKRAPQSIQIPSAPITKTVARSDKISDTIVKRQHSISPAPIPPKVKPNVAARSSATPDTAVTLKPGSSNTARSSASATPRPRIPTTTTRSGRTVFAKVHFE